MPSLFGRKKKGEEASNGSSSSKSSKKPQSGSGSSGRRGKSGSGSGGGGSGHSSSGSGRSKGDSSVPPGYKVFRLKIPEGVQPGESFMFKAGNQRVRARCPRNMKPGQLISMTVKIDDGPPPDEDNSPNVINTGERQDNGQFAYNVRIPEGIRGGDDFAVKINGYMIDVTCPMGGMSGMSVRIVPPPPPEGAEPPRDPSSLSGGGGGPQAPPPNTKLFEVKVPRNARPGMPFALMAGGQRVLVNCPANARPGQRIRFPLPKALFEKPKDDPNHKRSQAAELKLNYDKDGWTRTIRVTDMKFQWVRMDDNGDVDCSKRFDTEKSAYVRRLDFVDGDDWRLRDGVITLVEATEAVVDSFVSNQRGEEIVSFADIGNAQEKTFEDKVTWFQSTCQKLSSDWSDGHMRIAVRREFLLGDSMAAVMSLSREDMRKMWRFEFIGEEAIDAGGVAREWFQLLTEDLFNPENGMWLTSATNQMCMTINPGSSVVCGEDHLQYFRFLGRIMGKAMFDQQLVAGHMVRHLYKHMLGWPCIFQDLELVDEEYYNNLKKTSELSSDEVEYMYLDFTTTLNTMGTVETVDLVEGGADIDVTAENLPEYLEACFKHRLLGEISGQLNELLLGFFDVIPEPLMTIFDYQELELLMCGLPEIDMEDWKRHTEYMGTFTGVGVEHEVCQWFWEVLDEEFDQELRARLLQFVTATSGVPSRGFAALQGNDGNVRKFTIMGVPLAECLYPRAHTCFNRIDLPIYESKEQLKEKLKLVVLMESTGFGIE